MSQYTQMIMRERLRHLSLISSVVSLAYMFLLYFSLTFMYMCVHMYNIFAYIYIYYALNLFDGALCKLFLRV